MADPLLSAPTDASDRRDKGATAISAVTVLIILYLSSLLSFGDRVIFGMVIKPLGDSLHLSSTELGILAGAAFAISYSIFSPIGGWAVDRFSRKIVLAWAIGFWSLMTLFSGLAQNFTTMALARIGLGVGESFLAPLAVSLISDAVPRDKRSRIFALYISASPAGVLAALLGGGALIGKLSAGDPLILPLLGTVEPWRALFLCASLPGFVLAGFVLLILKEHRSNQAKTRRRAKETSEIREFIARHWRLILSIYVGGSAIQLTAYTWIVWQVNYFEHVYGWTGSHASLVLGWTSGIANIVGCLLTGPIIYFLAKRGVTDAPLRVALFGGAACSVFVILGLLVPTVGGTVAILCIASFFSYYPSAGMYNAIGEAVPASVRGRLAGLQVLSVGVITNSLGPFLVGYFSDIFAGYPNGMRTGVILTALVSLLTGASILMLSLKSYRRRMSEM